MNNLRRHSNDDEPSVSGQQRTEDKSIFETIVVLDSDEEGQETMARGKKRKGGSTEDEVKKKKKKKKLEQEFCPEPLDITWIHPESYPVAKR